MTGVSSTTTDPHMARMPRRHLAMFIGTTPSMQDGRLVEVGAAARRLADGASSVPASSGDDTHRVAFCSEPGDDGLSGPPVVFFFLKLRCRWIQLPPPRDVSTGAAVFARSGSLLHLSFDRMNVFVKKYFLLRMYLAMASAHARRPQNLAHSSAHRPRP